MAIPGGMGTLEELAEVVTWSQLGLHSKPRALLDVEGYFASLLAFVDHAVAEHFVRPEHRALVLSDTDPGLVLDRMTSWASPSVDKWLDCGAGDG